MNDGPRSQIEVLRQKVSELIKQGRHAAALRRQLVLIRDTNLQAAIGAEDFHRLGILYFALQSFGEAARAFRAARQRDPQRPGVGLNIGLSLIRIDRLEEARVELEAAWEQSPDDVNLLDGLADLYGKLGQLDQARQYGERALEAKDRASLAPPPSFVMPGNPPEPICLERPEQNVISFSLFGDSARYCQAAVSNAIVAPSLYPGWHCCFYCDDTVPLAVRQQLVDARATVRMMPRPQRWSDALFWRFLVMEQPQIRRFLIRDCDSIINIRERRAVDEWLGSSCYFHLMRDHTSHTALIMAGMWGGVAGVLPTLTTMLKGFSYDPQTESRTADQHFLGRVVWPMIKSNCLIHDRHYRSFGAQPFPVGSELPSDCHVGQNESARAKHP